MGQQRYEVYSNITIQKPKFGVVQTKRQSFEITPELSDELDHFITHQRVDGTKMSKSEFIRIAIKHQLSIIKQKGGLV